MRALAHQHASDRRQTFVRRAFALVPAAALAAVALTASASHAAELELDGKSGLHYLEVVTGGAAPDTPLPVVVAIHGLGDNPESFKLLLDDLPARARVIVPRGPMPRGEDGYSWFAFHNDDGGEGSRQQEQGIRESAVRLAQLVGSIAAKYGGPSRTVVCGFSQGGILSFAVASMHPELVAAAIPVAGYLPPALWPAERPKIKPLPKIIALHGDDDRLISAQSAKWTVEALRSNGFDTSLKTWPGVGHAIPPDMRSMLMASVVSAVEALSPAGTVLEGPPSPVALPPMRPVPGANLDGKPGLTDEELKGFPAREPDLDSPSPLDDAH
jgi:phospholipase/carboxylesterase